MEDAPTPYTINKPNSIDNNSTKLVKEYSIKENEKEIKIILGISNSFFNIIIKEDVNTFNGQFNLKDLQSKDKYFRMFDTIDEAYKELLPIFNENQYNIKIEGNNLILNIEIEHSHKKMLFLLFYKKVK